MSSFEPEKKTDYLRKIYYHLKQLEYNDSTEMNYLISAIGIIFLMAGFLSDSYTSQDGLNFFC